MAGKKREPLKDKEKIRQGREEFLDIKEFAKRYIGSPGFNERFFRKMNELANLEDYSWANKGNYNWAGIWDNTKDNPWSYTINPNYLDKTVLNLWAGLGSSSANPVGNSLSMTEQGMYGIPKVAVGRRTMAHELGHLIDNGVINIYKKTPFFYPLLSERIQYSSLYPELRRNKEGKELIKLGIRPDTYMPKKKYDALYSKYKNKYHDGFEEEPYADFFQMRYELDKLGLYDSTKANNKFTKETLDKFREATNSGEGNGGYPFRMAIKRIFDKFSDDQIIEIMNTVAKADSSKLLKDQLRPDPNQAYYAKKGTRLIKKSKRK